jgi:hypothetical protein
MEATMRKVLTTALMAALAMGCKNKSSSGGGGDKADKPGEGAAVKLPALTADPDPGAITAADKPPFESVKFRQLAERSDKGWPKYDVYNLGTKPIVFMALYGYAYDKDGNQVAHTSTPLSWNGNIKPGTKSDFDVSIGGFPEDQVPATAVSYELCYDSIKFDGDQNSQDQRDRCPDKKPKGK